MTVPGADEALVSPLWGAVWIQKNMLNEGLGVPPDQNHIVVLRALKLPLSQRRFFPLDAVFGTSKQGPGGGVVPHLPDLLPGIPAGSASNLEGLGLGRIPFGTRVPFPRLLGKDYRVTLVFHRRVDLPFDPIERSHQVVVQEELVLACGQVDTSRWLRPFEPEDQPRHN